MFCAACKDENILSHQDEFYQYGQCHTDNNWLIKPCWASDESTKRFSVFLVLPQLITLNATQLCFPCLAAEILFSIFLKKKI